MTLSLKDRLETRRRLGHFRELQIPKGLTDFSSNDFLGLARSSSLAIAVVSEWEKIRGSLNGLGSTGSRLLSGNSAYALDLEHRIARFHGVAAGCLFSCGYMANVGLLSTVCKRGDVLFYDARVHASMQDGIRLGRGTSFPFRHNDPEHLEKRLRTCSSRGDRFICIESVYSTDGSIAPLQEICQLAKEYDACLIVDEAHATGVCGPVGRGLVAEQGLTPFVFAQIVTFGKALGTYGAIVLGDEHLKEALINFATSYIYTTALPPVSLAAIRCSYEMFPSMETEREHLRQLIRIYGPHSSGTHIQSVPVPGNDAAKKAAKMLANHGFDVRPLLSPTVQRGKEVLRLCLHAFNTEFELAGLLHLLREVVPCVR